MWSTCLYRLKKVLESTPLFGLNTLTHVSDSAWFSPPLFPVFFPFLISSIHLFIAHLWSIYYVPNTLPVAGVKRWITGLLCSWGMRQRNQNLENWDQTCRCWVLLELQEWPNSGQPWSSTHPSEWEGQPSPGFPPPELPPNLQGIYLYQKG